MLWAGSIATDASDAASRRAALNYPGCSGVTPAAVRRQCQAVYGPLAVATG